MGQLSELPCKTSVISFTYSIFSFPFFPLATFYNHSSLSSYFFFHYSFLVFFLYLFYLFLHSSFFYVFFYSLFHFLHFMVPRSLLSSIRLVSSGPSLVARSRVCLCVCALPPVIPPPLCMLLLPSLPSLLLLLLLCHMFCMLLLFSPLPSRHCFVYASPSFVSLFRVIFFIYFRSSSVLGQHIAILPVNERIIAATSGRSCGESGMN